MSYIPLSVWGRQPGPAFFAGLSDSRPDVWHVGSSGEGRPTLLHQGKEPRAKSGHFQPSLGSRTARHPDSLSHRLSHPSNSPFPGKMASSNCTAATGIWRLVCIPKELALVFLVWGQYSRQEDLFKMPTLGKDPVMCSLNHSLDSCPVILTLGKLRQKDSWELEVRLC